MRGAPFQIDYMRNLRNYVLGRLLKVVLESLSSKYVKYANLDGTLLLTVWFIYLFIIIFLLELYRVKCME